MTALGSFVNCCWFIFKWGLLVAVAAAVVAGAFLYQQVDEGIRRQVEAKFASHYAALEIHVRAAQWVEGEGIEVRDLTVIEPGAEGPRTELLHLEEVFLDSRGDLEELLSAEPQISRIVLRRPTLRVTRRSDGSWSAQRLFPLPQFSRTPPAMVVENGTIEIFDPTANPASTFVVRDVNLTLHPPAAAAAPGTPALASRKVEAVLSADYLRQVVLTGMVAPDGSSWALAGRVEGLAVSPELRQALPAPLGAKLAALGTLRGEAEAVFRLGCDSAQAELRFDVTGRLSRGRIDDARLPHPLTDLQAGFEINNAGAALTNLTGSCGQASLRLSGRRAGFDPSSPMSVAASVRQLELDRRLLELCLGTSCPEAVRRLRLQDSLVGEIDGDLELDFDGRVWRPRTLRVECRNMALTYPQFPYRLQQTKGWIELKDDVLQASLTGYAGTRAVRITGRLEHPGSVPTGALEIQGSGIPLDETLLRALDSRTQAVVRALEPRGAIDVHFRLGRERAEGPLTRALDIDLDRCSLRYAKFPYPLANIRGHIKLEDDRWTFSDLSGTNDTGYFTGCGSLGPDAEGRKELRLSVRGEDVALEEELREALGQPNVQQLWSDLRLKGSLAWIALDLRHRTGDEKLEVAFRAAPKPESLSIEPAHFPYRLDDIRGELAYEGGRVTLEQFRARHRETLLSAAARCDLATDGGWRLVLDKLRVERLELDRELVGALPGPSRTIVGQLHPSGPLDLSGAVEVARAAEPGAPLTAAWDLKLGVNQASLECGARLTNICGDIRMSGRFDGSRYFSRGELDLVSLFWGGAQLTEVRGPIWIDDERVLFGQWVDRRRDGYTPNPETEGAQQPRPLTARLFGGTLYGDGWIKLDEVPRYAIQATLADGDLARAALEMGSQHKNIRGKIGATVALRGQGRSMNWLAGGGQVRLRDADVYELPVMIALLRVLSLRRPDTNAFSKSDIDFRVEGPHIYLEHIDFCGDTISLVGAGEMDFDSNIRLAFRSMLGRSDLNIPVLREVIGGASEQILQIHVDGTLQNPVTSRELLPALNQALPQMGSEGTGDREQGTAERVGAGRRRR